MIKVLNHNMTHFHQMELSEGLLTNTAKMELFGRICEASTYLVTNVQPRWSKPRWGLRCRTFDANFEGFNWSAKPRCEASINMRNIWCKPRYEASIDLRNLWQTLMWGFNIQLSSVQKGSSIFNYLRCRRLQCKPRCEASIFNCLRWILWQCWVILEVRELRK